MCLPYLCNDLTGSLQGLHMERQKKTELFTVYEGISQTGKERQSRKSDVKI